MSTESLHHSTIDYFLWDLDGTLCNTIDLIIATYSTVIKEFFDVEADPDLLKSHIGLPLEHCYADYAGRYGRLASPSTPREQVAEHSATPITTPAGGERKPSFSAAAEVLASHTGAHSAMHAASLSSRRSSKEGAIVSPRESAAREPFGRSAAEVAVEMCRRHEVVQTELWPKYVTAYPGVNDFVAKLKAMGKRLAIVTSRTPKTAVRYADACEVTPLFETMVTPEDTHFHKPTAAPALAGLARLGGAGARAPVTESELEALTSHDRPLSVARCVFIGDSVYDIECGASAGMRTVFVEWGAGRQASLKTPPTAIASKSDDFYSIFGVERDAASAAVAEASA